MRLVDRVALPLPNDLALPFKGQDGFTLVDADVFDRFADADLYITGAGYVITHDTHRMVHYLHRLIVEPPAGLLVDHINGDKADNRRANLRVCTYTQNAQNRFKHCRTGQGRVPSSVYRGVSWHSRAQRWSASIRVDGDEILCGTHDSEDAAALAYDAAARTHFGEFARLNFPKDGEQSALRDVA